MSTGVEDVIPTQPVGSQQGSQNPPSVTTPDPSSQPSKETTYLQNINSITVKQCLLMQEQLRGTEEPNVYVIYDATSGEKLYQAQEESAACAQQCCGGNRHFKITLYDKFNRAVVLIQRPNSTLDCGLFCGLFECCDKVDVSIKNIKSLSLGWNKIGTVRQSWFPFCPYFGVINSQGEEELNIRGPLIRSGCGCSVDYSIKTKSGDKVGNICKEWSGLCKETTSDVDLFSITFPTQADEKTKLLLISALFLIDFKYYESCATSGVCCCCCLKCLSG